MGEVFNTSENAEYIYSHDIPRKYRVNEKVYDKLLVELQLKFKELRQIFIEHEQDAWTNLTLTLNHPDKLKIFYDYEDIITSTLTSTQRQMIFEYRYLGLLPENEMNKVFVENYLKNQGQ